MDSDDWDGNPASSTSSVNTVVQKRAFNVTPII